MKNATRIFVFILLINETVFAKDFVFDIFGVLVNFPLHLKIASFPFKEVLRSLFEEKGQFYKIKLSYFEKLNEIQVDKDALSRCKFLPNTKAQDQIMPDIMKLWQCGEIDYRD